jgi:hypothetical protein
MPKFGQIWFNGGYFGDDILAPTNYKNSIKRVPLGFLVRKQFKHTIIFRVRRGNGYYGAILGELYQDKYQYFVPSSINNAQGQTARNALAQAVLNWQTVLTAEQKAEYHKRATKGLRMSGYNLYIREYVRANA